MPRGCAADNPRERSSASDAQRSSDDSGEAKQLRRKALSRSRQVRYRLKQRQHEINLSVRVAALKAEIETLQTTCHELRFRTWRSRVDPWPMRVSADKVQMETARAYLQCFRHGFNTSTRGPWVPAMTLGAVSGGVDGADVARMAQVRFVEAHFQADVTHGGYRGRNALLEQWRRYSTYFDAFELQPSSVVVRGCAGQTICSMRVGMQMRVTHGTIEQIMPHVLLRPSITAKLLGKTLTIAAVIELGFGKHGKIDSCEAAVSLVEGLRALLDTYEDVAFVLSDAFITPTGHIGRDLFELDPASLCQRPPPLPLEVSNHADLQQSSGAASEQLQSPVTVDELVRSSALGDLRLDLSFILAPLL